MANDIENDDQTPAAPAQAAPDDNVSADSGETESEDAGNELKGSSVNLQRAYSQINSALIKLADEHARRTLSLPHVDGQPMAEHLADVAKAAAAVGGLTSNLMIATHSVHDKDGGITVAYSANRLRSELIPANDDNAKAAIDATKSFVSKVEKLLGETAQVQTAKSQMKMIGQQNGEGMTVADLIIGLLNLPAPLIQAVSRAHSRHKHGQAGHAKLTAPKES